MRRVQPAVSPPPLPAAPRRSRAQGPVATFRNGLWQGVTAVATGGPALLSVLGTAGGKLRAILAAVGVISGCLWLIGQGPRVFHRYAPVDAYMLMTGLVFLLLLVGVEKFLARSMLQHGRRGLLHLFDADDA